MTGLSIGSQPAPSIDLSKQPQELNLTNAVVPVAQILESLRGAPDSQGVHRFVPFKDLQAAAHRLGYGMNASDAKKHNLLDGSMPTTLGKFHDASQKADNLARIKDGLGYVSSSLEQNQNRKLDTFDGVRNIGPLPMANADRPLETPKRPDNSSTLAPKAPYIPYTYGNLSPYQSTLLGHRDRGSHNEAPKDLTVSFQAPIWSKQLELSRLVIQDLVPNVLNGNIQLAMATTFLPSRKSTAPVVAGAGAGVGAAAPFGGLTRGTIEAMFLSDQQIGTSFKVFTPNKMLQHSANTDPNIAKTNKLHFWAASTVSIELGRVSLSENGKERVRTANIVLNTVIQPENVNADLSKNPKYRNLITGGIGEETTYRITATESRLKEILTGERPPPNPFKPETMKVGDQVTIDTGFVRTAEAELRGYFRPGIAGDVKYDSSHSNGNRLVITPRNDPVTGQPTRVIIASGQSITDIDKLSAGLILNPAMKGTENKDLGSRVGTAGEKAGFAAGFARALNQIADTRNNNHYNLVEIDLTKPAGRALYDQILRSGVIPPQKTGDEAPHIKAYGTVDFTLDKKSLSIQLAEYAERSTGVQLSATQCIELLSRVNVDRVFNIKYSSPDAAVRTGSKTARNSEGGDVFLPAFDFLRGKIENMTASHNAQVCGTEKATDYANPAAPEFLKFGCQLISVPKTAVKAIFSNAASLAAANEPPAYASLSLETFGKGTLNGRAAIDYLQNYKKADAGWFSQPTLDMTWKLKPNANTEAFLERLTHDVKAYVNAKTGKEDSNLMRRTGAVMMENADSNTAWMAELGFFKLQANNIYALRSLSTKEEVIKMLDKFAVTDPNSFLTMLNEFRKAGGSKEPYPIDVTYFARP